MSRIPLFIFALLLLGACKKSEDRKCWKGYGEYSEQEIFLDSIDTDSARFKLYKNLKYRLVEDSVRKVVLKGGSNMLNNISIEQIGYEIRINNLNKCNFLRSGDNIVEAEIHYPYFRDIYVEATDSIISEDTLHAVSLRVEMREGGGSGLFNVDVKWLYLVISYGTADYTLNGYAEHATVKVQNNGYGDARGFWSPDIYLYNNSTGNLKCNIDSTEAEILMEGTGNILYLGNPDSLNFVRKGSGDLIKL